MRVSTSMGTDISHSQWLLLATACGALYLLFDAARFFVQQLSSVRLRSWSGDEKIQRGSRWFHYNPLNFSLISGALLQIALVVAVGATVGMLADRRGVFTAIVMAVGVWAAITLVWKLLLAVLSDDVGEVLIKSILPVSHLFYYLFWPLLAPLRALLEMRERRREAAPDDEAATEEEVQAYIDVGEEEGILEEGEGKLLQSIVDFGDKLAHELMTPRIDVLAIEADSAIEDLASLLSESKYSRIPVYEKSIDRMIGIVHIKDVFEAHLKGRKTTLRELARPPYFISETKKVSELLREFQIEHEQVAIVVDEYGGTAGLISIEDVIEEIVGEISDEHEDIDESIVEIGEGVHLVNGLFRVEMLQEIIGADLQGVDYETVAGLIFTSLGRVPKTGESVTKNGVVFQIEKADRKRIYRVRVSKEPVPVGETGQ